MNTIYLTYDTNYIKVLPQLGGVTAIKLIANS